MSETPRFVAFDVHKSSVLVAALDATLQVVLSPRRVRLADLPEWAAQALCPTDRVVLEAKSLAWTLYDLLSPLVAEVQVAHPRQGKADQHSTGQNGYARYLASGAPARSEPHPDGVGAPASRAGTAGAGGPSGAPRPAAHTGQKPPAELAAEPQSEIGRAHV